MSLRWRLFLSFAAVLLLSLAVAGVSLAALWHDFEGRVIISRLTDIAAPLYTQAASRVHAEGGVGEAMAFLNEQSEALDVEAMVLKPDGTILYATQGAEALRGQRLPLPAGAPPGRANLRAPTSGSFRAPDGSVWRFVVLPLPQSPRSQVSAGWFVVAQDENRVPGIWMHILPRILIAAGLGLVSALLAAVLLARWLTRPLNRLRRAIDAMAAGDYSQRVPEDGYPETIALSRGFNRLAEEAERSRAMIQGFVATLSHELRTPLTALRGFLQALLDGSLAEPEERERALRLMQKETQRLQRLVSELLDLSRLQAQQAPLTLEPLDLGELVRHVVDIFDPRAESEGIELRDEVPSPLVVSGDADRLEQVLTNLIDNAIKHTPAGGTVTISARVHTEPSTGAKTVAPRRIVDLAVHNTGSYIPPEVIPHLFEPFYQGPGARPGGAGLGLAIARQIAAAHGGDLRAESSLDGGTTFTLSLPAQPRMLESPRPGVGDQQAPRAPRSGRAPARPPARALPPESPIPPSRV